MRSGAGRGFRPVQAVSGPDQGRVFTAAVREG
jgi:hypothetical protein